MAHRCDISGKSRQHGHRVSHANNKRKHVFRANLQNKKIFVRELGRSIRLKLSTNIIRTIDKIGFEQTVKKYGLKVKDLV